MRLQGSRSPLTVKAVLNADGAAHRVVRADGDARPVGVHGAIDGGRHQRRLEHVFGLEVGDLAEGTYGLTVLPLDDDANGVQGRSWAYVSLVDGATGDPTNWW